MPRPQEVFETSGSEVFLFSGAAKSSSWFPLSESLHSLCWLVLCPCLLQCNPSLGSSQECWGWSSKRAWGEVRNQQQGLQSSEFLTPRFLKELTQQPCSGGPSAVNLDRRQRKWLHGVQPEMEVTQAKQVLSLWGFPRTPPPASYVHASCPWPRNPFYSSLAAAMHLPAPSLLPSPLSL